MIRILQIRLWTYAYNDAMGVRSTKASMLLSSMKRSPREFIDRIITFSESSIDRGHLGAKYLLQPETILLEKCGIDASFLDEAPLREIKQDILEKQKHVPLPTSGVLHDANFSLAAFCYAYCRSRRPSEVVETGVGNGVTTSFILQALSVNRHGTLSSIDLPPLGQTMCGRFIPENIKKRWRLYLGRTRRILPGLLSKIGQIDVFLHDSLHSRRNMMFEFMLSWEHLRIGGLLISDDVAFNHAFRIFTEKKRPEFAGVHESAIFGAAVKPLAQQ